MSCCYRCAINFACPYLESSFLGQLAIGVNSESLTAFKPATTRNDTGTAQIGTLVRERERGSFFQFVQVTRTAARRRRPEPLARRLTDGRRQ
jgi:hypothetical protein